jgi:hypothetical protein
VIFEGLLTELRMGQLLGMVEVSGRKPECGYGTGGLPPDPNSGEENGRDGTELGTEKAFIFRQLRRESIHQDHWASSRRPWLPLVVLVRELRLILPAALLVRS